MIAMRWTMRLLGLISTVVVARLLAPSDYGVVAIAMIAVGLLETIAYLGVDLSLIKDQSAGHDEFDSAWTIQLIQGIAISTLLYFSAPWVAIYFNEPRAHNVILWLSLRPIIDSLQNIGLVALRRDLDFAREFRFNLLTKILGVCVQITAALYFRNYWSLVMGMVAASVITSTLSYLMHPYRPRLTLTKAASIWSFSQWLLVSRVGSFFNRRADEFVVGRLSGTSAMGGYHVVNEIATMPTNEIIMPMRRALYPALARIATAKSAYQRMVVDSLRASAVICVGLGFGLACVSDLVVPLVLGDKWLSTVPVMRWLALFGVSASLSSVLEVPLWVAGRTRLSAILNWIELALVIPIILTATQIWGVEGAAASRFLVSLAILPLTCILVGQACEISLRMLASALYRPLISGLALTAAIVAIGRPEPMSLLLILLLKVTAGALAYMSTTWALWRHAGRPEGLESSVFAAVAQLWIALLRNR